jgi:GNAT superfamily N-acetyltransferase
MQDAAYAIRPARADEVARLPVIERAAAQLFRGRNVGTFSLDDVLDAATHARAQREGRLFVADRAGEPVGFAIGAHVGGTPQLRELDVHPDHGRRGLGARLVAAVVEWARAQGAASLTLSTFRDVPWNAPFCERLGFRALEAGELDEAQRALLAREAALGLPSERRVVMRLALSGEPRAGSPLDRLRVARRAGLPRGNPT